MAANKKQTRSESPARRSTPDPDAGRSETAPVQSQLVTLFEEEDGLRPRPWPIDEMNITETPFALLAQRNESLRRLELSPGGDRYLATNGKHLLPTALAEQAVIGLLWMHREQNGFRDRKIQFRLRDLVTEYIYPGRYRGSRPDGKLLQAVKQQLHRVAATRIYTENWYNKKLGRRTAMDAAIIDYIEVQQRGGKNRPEILEVGWGEKFYESIRARYTKDLDPSVYLRIQRPLDRRLYRWLDRQLHSKARQDVRSIQTFARSKLGMTGSVLNRGGRTASSYVSSRLSQAIERLNGIGFPVRLEVDTSVDDYRLTFFRLTEGPNEVAEVDDAGDLLRHFTDVMHGASARNRKRRAFRDADRTEAERWIEAYGLDVSMQMVDEAKRIQQRMNREPILIFRGLGLYEQAAYGACERRHLKAKGQGDLLLDAPTTPSWERYVDAMISQCDDEATDRRLRAALEQELSQDPGWTILGKDARSKWFAGDLSARKAKHYGLLDREAYDALRSDPAALEAELQKRHELALSDLSTQTA